MNEEDAPTERVNCVCSVLQEAVSTGDPELVQLVLQYRDFKRATERLAGIPELLSKLRQVGLVYCHWLNPNPKSAHKFTQRLGFTSSIKILFFKRLFGLFFCVIIDKYKV